MPQTESESGWIMPENIVPFYKIFLFEGESTANLSAENPGDHVHLTLLNREFPDSTQNGLYISYRFYPLFPGSTPSVLEGAFKVHSIQYTYVHDTSPTGAVNEYNIIRFKLADNPEIIKQILFASRMNESLETATYTVIQQTSDGTPAQGIVIDRFVYEHVVETIRSSAPPGVMSPAPAPAPAPAPVPVAPVPPSAEHSMYSQNLTLPSKPINNKGGYRRITRQRKNRKHRSRKNKRHSRSH